MVWILPEEIEIGRDISSLDDAQLEYYHEQMHVFWERILEGFQFSWSLQQVYNVHKETVIQMLARKMVHLSPINSLDEIPIAKDKGELKKIIKNVIGQKTETGKMQK